jgi:hypothetical protein
VKQQKVYEKKYFFSGIRPEKIKKGVCNLND